MLYKKGDKKPEGSGRKKGTKNKTTEYVRQCIRDIVADELRKVPAKLAEIESAKDYIEALSKLARYVLPSLQSVEMTESTEAHKAQQELLARLNAEMKGKSSQPLWLDSANFHSPVNSSGNLFCCCLCFTLPQC